MKLGALAAGGTVVALALSACGGHRSGLSVQASPASATFDVPFTVLVRGVPAGARARIAFSGRTRSGRVARAQVTARADARGRITLADYYLYTHLDPTTGWPTDVTITVSSGRMTTSTHARRTSVRSSDLVTTDERPRAVGFYGEWIRPPGAHHRTAILLFGGSEGGLFEGQLATTLAAHGYPVLELAYFGEPGLPQSLSRIPLEYFARALRWLRKQPAADPSRLVTFGISRGGEASLIIASTFPELVHGAVGYVPSAIVVPSPLSAGVPAWTYRNRAVRGDTSTAVPTGWIRVERINGPVFVVGGDDDALWASGYSVRNIERRLLAHGRHDFTALDYPKAGHELGAVVPRQIELSAAGYGVVDTRYGQLILGGSPGADEAALEDSWPKLLAFLARVGDGRR